MQRSVHQTYQDPIEVIWLNVASQLNMRVERSPDVFASWDGVGVLRIGTPETLDPDDSLAQMILHEVCHWMIEGPEAFHSEDWGLIFGEPDHEHREFATLRLQCHFADQFQLRHFFGSTTDYRHFYDSLGPDPLEVDLEPKKTDPSVRLANRGLRYCQDSGVDLILLNAIQATKRIADTVDEFASAESIWKVDANRRPKK